MYMVNTKLAVYKAPTYPLPSHTPSRKPFLPFIKLRVMHAFNQ